jgi:hypothetical protein
MYPGRNKKAIPAAMSAQAIPGFDNMQNHFVRWMQVFGRLRPDLRLAEAQAGLQPWFKAMLDEDTRREARTAPIRIVQHPVPRTTIEFRSFASLFSTTGG